MIVLKSEGEIEKIRRASRLVARVLRELRQAAGPGVTTLELDRIAEEMTRAAGAEPAFKGYRGFPNSLCVSLNEVVVHGIPSGRKLRAGDVVSIDFGVRKDGFFGDSAITFPVSEASGEAKKQMKATSEALGLGIEQARAGNRLEDISSAVQSHCERAGYSVVRAFVGHGIGRDLHEAPQVPNYGRRGRGVRLKPGMTLAIEPMVNAGTCEVETLEDGWTVVTKDRRLSVHFEHTIAVTDGEPEVLSRDEKE